ncbi:MAG: ComF family protein [Patescibacteria group bacterium]
MSLYTQARIQLLDLVFPRTCVGCVTAGAVACTTCWQRWQSPWVEHRPVPEIQELLSFGAYKAVFIQRLIQRWKFEGDTTTAETIAQLLSPEFSRWLNQKPATLVPIPLHERKFRERGFNQTEDLAKAINQELGISWLPLLQRTIYTQPQKSVAEEEKRANVEDAFQVDQRFLLEVDKTSRVIILDDIFTTGSTINAAAQTLRAAGFRSVSALVVARG